MADREKVLRWLTICGENMDCSECCPYLTEKYKDPVECMSALMRDALELLKEQEPVEPIKLENWWKCPSCSGNIVCNMKYCPGCGRKVKWK